MAAGGGNGRHGHGTLGVEQRPLQGLQTTHGPADHQPDPPDAQGIGQRHLDPHLIADRHGREAPAPGPSIRGRAGRSGGAVAAAEGVAAQDEIAPRVQDATRPEERGPPFIRVGRAGQGVTDDDGVVGPRGQGAPGPIGDAHRGQDRTGLQRERPLQGQPPGLVARRRFAHAAASRAVRRRA